MTRSASDYSQQIHNTDNRYTRAHPYQLGEFPRITQAIVLKAAIIILKISKFMIKHIILKTKVMDTQN